MYTRTISSLQHPIVKHLKKLVLQRSYRYEQQSLVIFGAKMIREAAKQITIRRLFVDDAAKLPKINAQEFYQVNKEIFHKISDMPNPEPIAAEIAMPSYSSLNAEQFILVLDQIRDPGNLGTLFRSALAFNVEGVIVLSSTVDPYNDKSLRASKGAVLQIPFWEMSEEEWLTFIDHNLFNVYAADTSGKDFIKSDFQFPLMLVLGNESQGISSAIKKTCHLTSVPMNRATESLNVAIAGSILLQHLGRSYVS